MAEVQENPLDAGGYTAPMMSPEEIEAMTVPFGQISERLPAVLEEYGVAIVAGVISEPDLTALEKAFSADIMELVDSTQVELTSDPVVSAACHQLREGGVHACPLQTGLALGKGNGFLLDRCLPHGSMAWAVRRHENVHAVFRVLYPGSTDLVTSLDATFFTPASHPPASFAEFAAHCDQNKHDTRLNLGDCDIYQGVLYVWPSLEDGSCSTTVVWPGSHRNIWPMMMAHGGFEKQGEKGRHYCEIRHMCAAGMPSRELPAAREIAKGWARDARRVVVPAGGLLLWNSRTLHTGWGGGPRLAQAVCLEPIERRSDEQRLAKLRLAALGLPSTHWASVAMQHDMCLRKPGVFGGAAHATETKTGVGNDDPDQVLLPLKPCIQPVALARNADMSMEGPLAGLVRVKFSYVGMWKASSELKDVLESSVTNEYSRFL